MPCLRRHVHTVARGRRGGLTICRDFSLRAGRGIRRGSNGRRGGNSFCRELPSPASGVVKEVAALPRSRGARLDLGNARRAPAMVAPPAAVLAPATGVARLAERGARIAMRVVAPVLTHGVPVLDTDRVGFAIAKWPVSKNGTSTRSCAAARPVVGTALSSASRAGAESAVAVGQNWTDLDTRGSAMPIAGTAGSNFTRSVSNNGAAMAAGGVA